MKLFNYFFLLFFCFSLNSQNIENDVAFIDKIYKEALSNGKSYQWL